jgi:hypothetical protein
MHIAAPMSNLVLTFVFLKFINATAPVNKGVYKDKEQGPQRHFQRARLR